MTSAFYGFAVSSDTLRAIHRTSVLKKMSFEVKRARKTTTFAMGVHFSKLRASVFRRRATSSSSLICFPRNGGARSVTSRVMHRDSLENRTHRDRFPLPCRCTYDEYIYIYIHTRNNNKIRRKRSNTKRRTIFVELDLFAKYRGTFRIGPRLPISAINKTRSQKFNGNHQRPASNSKQTFPGPLSDQTLIISSDEFLSEPGYARGASSSSRQKFPPRFTNYRNPPRTQLRVI